MFWREITSHFLYAFPLCLVLRRVEHAPATGSSYMQWRHLSSLKASTKLVKLLFLKVCGFFVVRVMSHIMTPQCRGKCSYWYWISESTKHGQEIYRFYHFFVCVFGVDSAAEMLPINWYSGSFEQLSERRQVALFCVKPYMTSLNDCGVLCITLHFLQFDALDYSECVSSVFVPLCFSPLCPRWMWTRYRWCLLMRARVCRVCSWPFVCVSLHRSHNLSGRSKKK